MVVVGLFFIGILEAYNHEKLLSNGDHDFLHEHYHGSSLGLELIIGLES